GVPGGPAAALGRRAVRERPAVLRARAEGVGRRLSDLRRPRRALVAARGARRGPRDHAVRLRTGRAREHLHGGVANRGLTGVLLVGGASRRFGSPKALARFGGETLAERVWRLLGEACDERVPGGQGGRRGPPPLPRPRLEGRPGG